MRDGTELHALEPEDFEREVRSFEHWFGAVEDYLTGLEGGHRTDLMDACLTPEETERLVATLCSYVVAETAALEASSGLIRIAPNRATKIYLATQVADEARHTEVMLQRMRDLGVADPEKEISKRAAPSIMEFKKKLLGLVDAKQWDLAIFAQNIALECMEFTVFRAHAQRADPQTKDMLERVLRDERRHIGFGENELGRRLKADPSRNAWIELVKDELEHFVLQTFEHTVQELGVPRDVNEKLGRDYLEAVKRLGF
jgi:1,2-phenylacetyl-CoA epoxidase catalytic subunit